MRSDDAKYTKIRDLCQNRWKQTEGAWCRICCTGRNVADNRLCVDQRSCYHKRTEAAAAADVRALVRMMDKDPEWHGYRRKSSCDMGEIFDLGKGPAESDVFSTGGAFATSCAPVLW